MALSEADQDLARKYGVGDRIIDEVLTEGPDVRKAIWEMRRIFATVLLEAQVETEDRAALDRLVQ